VTHVHINVADELRTWRADGLVAAGKLHCVNGESVATGATEFDRDFLLPIAAVVGQLLLKTSKMLDTYLAISIAAASRGAAMVLVRL